MSEFWLDATAAALNSAWQGALLAAAAWTLLRWGVKLRPGARHAAWVAVFVLVMLLPLGVWVAPGIDWNFAAPLYHESAGETESVALQGWSEPVANPSSADQTQPPLTQRKQAAGEISAIWASWLLAAWLGVSVVLLVRVGQRVAALERIKLSGYQPAGQLAEAVAGWTRKLAPGRQARLLLSEEVEGPILAGLWRPAVILPKNLQVKLELEELWAVWLHEMAHLRRRDDWLELVEQIAIALFPLQPALLFIKRQADQAREEACDAWVVQRTDDGLG